LSASLLKDSTSPIGSSPSGPEEQLRDQNRGCDLLGHELRPDPRNDAFLRMTGFTRDEAIGLTWQELMFLPNDRVQQCRIDLVTSRHFNEPGMVVPHTWALRSFATKLDLSLPVSGRRKDKIAETVAPQNCPAYHRQAARACLDWNRSRRQQPGGTIRPYLRRALLLQLL
jgi:hypothetical protein